MRSDTTTGRQSSVPPIEQSLQQAIAHHQAGRLQEAESLYHTILRAQPDHIDAKLNLEALTLQARLVALFAAKHFGEATALAQSMVERFPLNGFGWMMLGVLFRQEGRIEEALAYTQKGVALSPTYAAAHYNLGNIFIELERLEEAEACFRRALQIRPDYAEAYNNLGYILKKLHRLDEAEASFQQALQIKPGWAEVYGSLGLLSQDQGRLDEALAYFQQQIRLTPENSTTQHIIASLTGKNTERAPAQYVERSFNNPNYANNFDTYLQKTLGYEAPKKLVELVTRYAPPIEKWDVLDLGCGTGLVGLEIAPFVRQLVGVDLSARMLEKANARNLYQRLVCSDLLAMMRGERASSYDVIIAADVFVYLGKLDEILVEIKRLLRPGGVFAFSVEDLVALRNGGGGQGDGIQPEYQLEITGRYTHSLGYLDRIASVNGFLGQATVAVRLRMEKDKPVNGHLMLWESGALRGELI